MQNQKSMFISHNNHEHESSFSAIYVKPPKYVHFPITVIATTQRALSLSHTSSAWIYTFSAMYGKPEKHCHFSRTIIITIMLDTTGSFLHQTPCKTNKTCSLLIPSIITIMLETTKAHVPSSAWIYTLSAMYGKPQKHCHFPLTIIITIMLDTTGSFLHQTPETSIVTIMFDQMTAHVPSSAWIDTLSQSCWTQRAPCCTRLQKQS